MSKKVKETPVQQSRLCLPIYGIWGLAMAFVIGSIAWTSYLVLAGTTGYVRFVLVAPQVLFGTIVILYKFGR